MSRIGASATIGVLAGCALAGAYFVAPYAGVHVSLESMVAAATALVFASAVAVFALLAFERLSPRNPYATTRLNEMPAARFVSLFHDPERIQIVARPDISVGEILVRHSEKFKGLPEQLGQKIVLTIRGRRRTAFNPVVLRQLFATLSPFKLEHVVLLNDPDDFVGYIPGARALKEFVGNNAETKISDVIVKALGNPSEFALLRTLSGVARDDVVSETDNIRHAAIKCYTDDAIQGLVVHKHLKPIGFISKVDVLTLASSETMIAGR